MSLRRHLGITFSSPVQSQAAYLLIILPTPLLTILALLASLHSLPFLIEFATYIPIVSSSNWYPVLIIRNIQHLRVPSWSISSPPSSIRQGHC